jgi:hypothetical protein
MADGIFDERMCKILRAMAGEFDEQAGTLEQAPAIPFKPAVKVT